MNSHGAEIRRTESGKLFVNTPQYRDLKQKAEEILNDGQYPSFYVKTETNEEFVHKLAVIAAAAILSDSIHRDEERAVCREICKELDIDWDMFSKKLDKETEKIISDFGRNYEKYLLKNIDKQPSRNAMVLFEAALHIVLADGIMTERECDFLASIGVLLQIPTAKMFARLGLFLRKEKDVVVAPPENFDWLYDSSESGTDYFY